MNSHQLSEKSPLFKTTDDQIWNDQVEYTDDDEGYCNATVENDDNFSQFRVEDYL